MSLIYTDYFQKSKVFLYPLLGIGRKAKYVPRQTYICWDGFYSTEDCKLILEYKTKPSESFKKFASRFLDKHVMYEDSIQISDNSIIYIFDFTYIHNKTYKSDYKKIVEGNYSKLSMTSKVLILDFFGDEDKAGEYINTFLSPGDSFEAYANFFDVEEAVLYNIGELCSKPDIEKETLVDNNYLLKQLLKKSSIYLTNK